jgi:hypothetical protein
MPHPERRCDVNEAYAQHFLARLEAAHSEYPPSRIFGFDQTSWSCCLGPQKVLTEKGTEAVKPKSSRGEEESYTGCRCISALGDKLPFWILTKGKTDHSHAQFGQPADITIRHSPNGWTTENQIIKYIEWLSNQYHSQSLMLSASSGPPDCGLVRRIHPLAGLRGLGFLEKFDLGSDDGTRLKAVGAEERVDDATKFNEPSRQFVASAFDVARLPFEIEAVSGLLLLHLQLTQREFLFHIELRELVIPVPLIHVARRDHGVQVVGNVLFCLLERVKSGNFVQL